MYKPSMVKIRNEANIIHRALLKLYPMYSTLAVDEPSPTPVAS